MDLEEVAKKKKLAQIPEPIGIRSIWTVAALLVVGVVVCLVGLLATAPGEDWAIATYLGGLVSAGVAATTLASLAAQRRRILFEAEQTAAVLHRLMERLAVESRPPAQSGLSRRLEAQRASASRYREPLLQAEAYELVRDLDFAIASAEALLEDLGEQQ
jgi:hypothetical protein